MPGERKRVADSLGDDDLGAQCLPKLPDVDPHSLCASRRWLARPEFLSEALGRDWLTATEEQQGEKCPVLRSAKRDVPISVYNLERPEE